MATRFPMGATRLLQGLRSILPQTKAEWAFSVLPDLGYAAMGAGMAPQGTSGLDRAALAGEDFLLSTLLSLGGRGSGRLLGRLSPQHSGILTNTGELVAAPLAMVAPRPIAERVYRQAAEDMNRSEQEQLGRDEEQLRLEQALLNSLMSGSGLAWAGTIPPAALGSALL